MIASTQNIVAVSFALGVALGAAIVLITIWMLHALPSREAYRR